MKYELVFDEVVYNNQMDLLFDITWKRKILCYKNYQYLGVLLLVVGAALIYNRPNIFGIGYAFLFFGLSNFVPFVYYYFKIRSQYKKFESAKIRDNESFKDVKIATLELTEKSWIMNVENNIIVTDWENFAAHLVKEDNLILITKDYRPYILGEIEVGVENFRQIISFVEEKIKSKNR
ncbi:hypothetical protein [Flavobacterium sp. FlaQc-48]|uniref:hypothetical protein n=1 Tax=Flavobacterium sp. FlaQc-48 TaxID=3374181 RepID=UPI0037575C43